MPEPTAEPTNENTQQRCRAITTDGHRCRNNATFNGHLCWPHFHHRNPVLPDPTHVAIPLLEDAASVQLVLSQITHGLLAHKLEIDRARALIYACQVAAATFHRPPRLPTPQPPLGTGNCGLATSPEPATALSDNDDLVHHLALDYQGIISGDGDLPAPSLHWQPSAPEATPWDLLYAAPNQSKPTPRSPSDPDTHCNCAICDEIRKKQAEPYLHPHLQPAVNPFCKRNQPGCQGPDSYERCAYCEAIYKYDPDKYNRRRRNSERREEIANSSPRASHPAGSSAHPVSSAVKSFHREEQPQPLPNPLPDQFPAYDPILEGHRLPETTDDALDLKACATTSDQLRATGSRYPATLYPDFPGNTPNLLPSNPFACNKTRHTHPGGYPQVGVTTHNLT